MFASAQESLVRTSPSETSAVTPVTLEIRSSRVMQKITLIAAKLAASTRHGEAKLVACDVNRA